MLATANKGLKIIWLGRPGVFAEPSSAFCTCDTNGPKRAVTRSAAGVSPGVQDEPELPLATLEGAPETAKVQRRAPALTSQTPKR